MKRVLAVLVGTAAIVGVVTLAIRMDRERDYRRLLDAGDGALRAGDDSGAVETLSGAIALRPDSMVAYYRRAEAYRAEHRLDEAGRDLHTANRLAPDATEPLVALGRLADEQRDWAQAAEWYGRAAEHLQDGDPGLLYALALARYRAGALAAAVDPLERVIATHDPDGLAHYALGLVYRDSHRSADAIAVLEEAIRIAPSLLPAREELADIYRVTGRPDEELAQLRALAALEGDAAAATARAARAQRISALTRARAIK